MIANRTKGNAPGPSVLALCTQEHQLDGCSAWRIWQPFAALEARGYPAWWGWRDDPELARPSASLQGRSIVELADAVIIPRLSWDRRNRANGLRWFEALHRAGKAVIYEIDDDLMSEDLWRREVELHGHTPEEATEIVESHRWAIAQCDGVTVTTHVLAEQVRQCTDKPVVVVPNAIDVEWFRSVQRYARRVVPGNQLTIGWFGGMRPERDVLEMAEAWGRIARRYSHVKFVVMGRQLELLHEHVPADRLVVIPWLDTREYPLALVNFDVGCCAVSDTPFNRCKSPIKAYEYTISGACVVASPTLYGDLLDDGLTGCVCETADEWVRALSRLIEDPGLRRRLQRRLLHRVEKRHSLAVNLWRWPAAWAEIVGDFRRRQVRQRLLSIPANGRAPILVGGVGTVGAGG